MKVKSCILLLVISLLFCSNIFPGENPQIITRIEIPSLMTSARKLSPLLENISPGSSSIVAVWISALAFNPVLKDFDITSPIQLIAYSSISNEKPNVEWCLVLNKKKDGISPIIQNKKLKIYIKELKEKAVLGYSEKLVNSIAGIPEFAAADTDSDLTIVTSPHKYLTTCKDYVAELKGNIISQFLDNTGKKPADINFLKVLQVKINYLEKILKQCSEIRFDVYLQNDRIKLISNIKPLPDSGMNDFIKAQNILNQPNIQKDVIAGKPLSGIGNIILTDAAKNGILSIFKDIAIETSDNYYNDFTNILSELLDCYSGEFSFYSDISMTDSVLYMRMHCNKDKIANLNKMFSEMYSENMNIEKLIYQLKFKDIKDIPFLRIFCKLSNDEIELLQGNVDYENAEKIFSEYAFLGKNNFSFNNTSLLIVSYQPEKDIKKSVENVKESLISTVSFNGSTISTSTEITEKKLKNIVQLYLK